MILVAGPPCGGKTTYVRNHRSPSDLVVDYDDIIEELGGTRYDRSNTALHAQAERVWIDRMSRANWVILTAPTRMERGRFRAMHHAEVVVVMASQAECLRRAASGRPVIWQDAIRSWYQRWQPSRSGNERIVWTDRTVAA